jgi:hypothetical protein
MAIELGPAPEAQRLLELQLAQGRLESPLAGIFAKQPSGQSPYPAASQSYKQPFRPNFFDYPQGGGDTAAQEQLAKRPAEDFNKLTNEQIRDRIRAEQNIKKFMPLITPIGTFAQYAAKQAGINVPFGPDYNISKLTGILKDRLVMPYDYRSDPQIGPITWNQLPSGSTIDKGPFDFLSEPLALQQQQLAPIPGPKPPVPSEPRSILPNLAPIPGPKPPVPDNWFDPEPPVPVPVPKSEAMQIGFSPGTVRTPNVVGPALTGRRNAAEIAAAARSMYDAPTEIIDIDPQSDIDFYDEQLGEDVMEGFSGRGGERDFY